MTEPRREHLELQPAWLSGYEAGWEDAPRTVVVAHGRGWGLAVAVLVTTSLLLGIFIGRASASAPQVTSGVLRATAAPDGGSSAAPLVAEAPSPVATRPPHTPSVAARVSRSDPPAIEAGVAAYATRSHGDRYLALPDGPGVRVRICAGGRCVDRVSTAAGPALFRQRQGRVADLSYVDFAFLCRCRPELVGLLRVSIERSVMTVTPPPTDVKP